MVKNKKNRKGVMYSTNPDFECQYEDKNSKVLSPIEQNLKVCIDKHQDARAGAGIAKWGRVVGNRKKIGK